MKAKLNFNHLGKFIESKKIKDLVCRDVERSPEMYVRTHAENRAAPVKLTVCTLWEAHSKSTGPLGLAQNFLLFLPSHSWNVTERGPSVYRVVLLEFLADLLILQTQTLLQSGPLEAPLLRHRSASALLHPSLHLRGSPRARHGSCFFDPLASTVPGICFECARHDGTALSERSSNFFFSWGCDSGQGLL